MVMASYQPTDPAHLRRLLDAAGVDTVHLAAAARVTRQHISLILQGKRGCSAPVANAIAAALGAPANNLFRPRLTGRKDDKESSMRATVAPAPLPDEDDPFLYFDDVCAKFDIPERTLRYLRTVGEGPPFFKVGRKLRVRTSQAEKWWAEKYEHAAR